MSARGGALTASTLGASWTWGGASRLYALDTKAQLGTAARWQWQEGDGTSAWKLESLTWGANGNGGAGSAVDAPSTVWDTLRFTWRGIDGDPRDGAKIGRSVGEGAGLGLFSGMGWRWEYDNGVRLAVAMPGDGTAGSASTEAFRFEYGEGDQLERLIREAEGTITELEHGPHGRILSRDGQPFAYDPVGRRTEDDRFVYQWDWRSRLVSVTVKETWQDGENAYAGHQIRYEYDALGRLTAREHWGELPAGQTDDALRPFIERRAYVWDGQGLVAEAGYNDPAGTQLRWRKTYVPGPSGLDDAAQVIVDTINLPGTTYPGPRLYTYLRDELGTVLGLVAEDEGTDPARPPVPVRYLYTPYGESHAELGPELLQARFDVQLTTAGGTPQTLTDPTTHTPGGFELTLSLPVDPGTLAAGLLVEQHDGTTWQPVGPGTLAVAPYDTGGERLHVLLTDGWERGATYRLRLTQALTDTTGRPLAQARELQLPIPAQAGLAPAYTERYPRTYAADRSASGTVGGRFPGGQTSLFQGLWTDPVTGIAYARARWYDARNAAWLSEDPMREVDSPNLYAFVGWMPSMGVDPLGEEKTLVEEVIEDAKSFDYGYFVKAVFFTPGATKSSRRFFKGYVKGVYKVIIAPGVATYNGTGWLIFKISGDESYRGLAENTEAVFQAIAEADKRGETLEFFLEGLSAGAGQFMDALESGDYEAMGEGAGTVVMTGAVLHQSVSTVSVQAAPGLAMATSTGEVVAATGNGVLITAGPGTAAGGLSLMSSAEMGEGQKNSRQRRSGSSKGKRSLEDPESLRGATPEEIRELIPDDWTEMPLKKGKGTRFLNPKRIGEAVFVEEGWANADDLLHSGPYVKVSRNGVTTRIPLKGNAVLP